MVDHWPNGRPLVGPIGNHLVDQYAMVDHCGRPFLKGWTIFERSDISGQWSDHFDETVTNWLPIGNHLVRPFFNGRPLKMVDQNGYHLVGPLIVGGGQPFAPSCTHHPLWKRLEFGMTWYLGLGKRSLEVGLRT